MLRIIKVIKVKKLTNKLLYNLLKHLLIKLMKKNKKLSILLNSGRLSNWRNSNNLLLNLNKTWTILNKNLATRKTSAPSSRPLMSKSKCKTTRLLNIQNRRIFIALSLSNSKRIRKLLFKKTNRSLKSWIGLKPKSISSKVRSVNILKWSNLHLMRLSIPATTSPSQKSHTQLKVSDLLRIWNLHFRRSALLKVQKVGAKWD